MEFQTQELELCCVGGQEQQGRSGIYRGGGSKPAGQVVGLADPTSWPNDLSIFLVDLYFTLKQNISSVGASFSGDMTEWS